MSVHMLDHSNSQGPHESDVNKNILLTLQKYSKYLYFSKLICQQLICQQLFLRGAQKLFKVRSWHFLIFSTAINQNKEIELDHVDSGLKINRYALLQKVQFSFVLTKNGQGKSNFPKIWVGRRFIGVCGKFTNASILR